MKYIQYIESAFDNEDLWKGISSSEGHIEINNEFCKVNCPFFKINRNLKAVSQNEGHCAENRKKVIAGSTICTVSKEAFR